MELRRSPTDCERYIVIDILGKWEGKVGKDRSEHSLKVRLEFKENRFSKNIFLMINRIESCIFIVAQIHFVKTLRFNILI